MRAKRKSVIATVIFFALAVIGALRHEMWRDEAQAWMIAKASGNIIDLWANLGQEGHPPLWHLILWLLQTMNLPIESMQIFQVVAAAIGVFIIFEKAPFSSLEKVFICFGYFFLYEWSLLSRNYLTGNVLIICAFVHRNSWSSNASKAALLYLPLAMSSLFNVFSLMIAFVSGAAIVLNSIRNRVRPWLPGLILLIFCGAISAYSIARGNFGPNPTSPVSQDIFSVLNAIKIRDFLLSVFVIPEAGWWGAYFASPLLKQIGSFLGLTFMVLASIHFICRPKFGLFVLFSLIAICFVLVGVRSGGYRHSGYLWFTLILGYWMLLDEEKDKLLTPPFKWLSRASRIGFITTLLVQFFAGASAYSRDFRREFSSAKKAAVIIEMHAKEQNVGTYALASLPDWTGTPIAAYLNRPVFNPFTNSLDYFVEWGSRREETDQVSLERIEAFRQINHTPIYFVTIHHISPPRNYIKIGETTDGVIGDERYFIYFSY